jgi:acyl-CoA synthetase (NDP forming)
VVKAGACDRRALPLLYPGNRIHLRGPKAAIGASDMDELRIRGIVEAALAEGRSALTELEGMDVLEAMGMATPRRALVREAAAAGRAVAGGAFPGDRVVVKVVSAAILHKTEAGGVAISRNAPAEVEAAVAAMESRFAGQAVEGYSINEFVPFEPGLGREILAGYRLAPDFGPVLSLGFGGIYAEFLAKLFRPGAATLFLSPLTAGSAAAAESLSRNALQTLLCGRLRGLAPAIEADALAKLARAFLEAAPVLASAGILEFEVNPFAVSGSGPGARLVALDALARIGPLPSGLASAHGAGGARPRVSNPRQDARPIAKIDRLLRPRSAAVIGVSGKAVNNGRIILRNMLKAGFDPSCVYVVKPDCAEIDGCPCVPDVASLPEKVDLFILVVPAASAPGVLADLVEADKAESVIVIPGGFEEKAGTEAITARMASALERARAGEGGGPVIVGGNCLGLLSNPGKYNTLFIPEHKLPRRAGPPDPVALVSQSGAFAITRLSKHPGLAPKYVVTCGNQMDLTVGDFLERLAEDESIRVFAVYVEGFKPLDGEKALRACARITSSGRTVILYRAGRSAAGAAASASHTASIAGDYPVTRELFEQAGAIVTESLDDFDDALAIFSMLRGKRPGDPSRDSAPRLGALSNAGFECVAAADNLGGLELASFSPATAARLSAAFAKAGIGEIVDVHNPLDLTPMAGDEAYEECFRAILEDPGVDCGLAGIVPLTAALTSLAEGPDFASDLGRKDGIAARYGRLMAEMAKPWVAVVDSGHLYDPLARALESRGVPTFRSADRALAALGLWVGARRRAIP